MVQCLVKRSRSQHRISNKVIGRTHYWSVKHLQVISSYKLIVLLVYIILSNNTMHPNAQSCSGCKTNHPSIVNNPNATYEEFVFEHQVTRQDAIDVLQTLNQSFFDGPPASSCKSITCTRNVMKYCLGPQFINDHCWCELGHGKEGLPFIPHICYVGEKQYQASVGSCFFYEEVKECCCAGSLAQRWKHISRGSRLTTFSWTFFLILAVAVQLRTYILTSKNKFIN